ncbi:hypothetical protein IAT38_002663 [Cryptococcus sp. DSM 104549]
MLFLAPLVLLFTFFTTAFAAPINKVPPPSYILREIQDYKPLRFLTHFSSHIQPDTNLNLEWTGGSGHGVEVYYIPQWPKQGDYYPIDLIATKASKFSWRTPKADAYPRGTTFIVGIRDAVQTINADWYDVTGVLKFGVKA